jgi:methionyl aminopeptidase
VFFYLHEFSKVLTFTDPKDVAKIRESARLARKMLDFAESLVEPGITMEEIDILTHLEIVKHGAYPSPVNYCGFPKAVCSSVNEVVCHGIPDDRYATICNVILCDTYFTYVLISNLPYCTIVLELQLQLKRKLEKGDMVSIDVSVFYNGFHGDNCGTVIVGGDACGDSNAIALRDTTRESVERAIAAIGPGK